MERSSGPLLALPQHPARPDGPRLRRKLQKVAKTRSLTAKPSPGSATTLNGGPWEGKHSGGNSNLSTKAHVKPASLPLSPDLSDAKWLEYIRRSGYLCEPNSSAQSRGPASIPRTIIPELSHLTAAARVRDVKQQYRRLPPLPDTSPSSSTSTIMRRRAKTPVFSIGQLESLPRAGAALPPPLSMATPGSKKQANVSETIAEQYRALLDSRLSMYDDEEEQEEAHSEPAPSSELQTTPVEIRRNSSGEVPVNKPAAAAGLPNGSPTSEDGTLVAFDEETVYFKPVSFSPEPSSPSQNHEFPILSPSMVPDNLSLQICLDLLTRELSSAFSDRPQTQRSATDLASLQIWVMIEAYERLQDQLLDLRLSQDELRPLEMMFDMWLRALYTMHDSMTGGSRTSECDLELLETEPVD